MRMSGARMRVSLWVLIFVACVASVIPSNVYAVQITARSLTLEPNATAVAAGFPSSSAPSIAAHADTTGLANDHFKFHVTTTAGIQSVGFQYCTTAYSVGATCTTPTDLLSSGTNTSLGTTVGLGSSPTLTKTTNGAPYVSFTAPLAANNVEVTLNGVFNPSATNTTFYVWINTYTSNNATTGQTDQGTVAASTATPIIVSGTMPEYLKFCTAVSIALTGPGGTNVPDCTTATSGTVTFNQLFDPASTAIATSQMAAATNAGSGYQITYYGPTLTSGSNTITAAGGGGSTNTIGQSQFGLNLVHNTTLAVGTVVNVPTVTGAVYNGEALNPYKTDGTFAFVPSTATAVADSTSLVSDLQEYTVSYIANVPGHQPAGTYTSTITYVCTATY
jgi:hypothetical protein